MRAKRLDSKTAERLDDRALVRIVKSRAHEVGVPVDLDTLQGRRPHLETAQRFVGLRKRDRHSRSSGADLK
jgi:hypothetical protein